MDDQIAIVDDKADIEEEYGGSNSVSILHDLHPGSIETISSSSAAYGAAKLSSNLNDALIRDSNKFYKKNRPKFMEQAIIIPSVSNTIEMDNNASFLTIETHADTQADKMAASLGKHKFKGFKTKTLEQIEAENSRLAKILDTKHLRLKSVTNKVSLLDEDSNLESDIDDDDELKDALSDVEDGKYEGISKTNSLLKKYINRTENVRTRKNLLNSMFNQALYNQEKSIKFQMTSMEKNLLNPFAGATSLRPRPKTAVSYKEEVASNNNNRGRSARSTKSEQINMFYKNMSDRSTKIKLYKTNQRNLFKNEAVTGTAIPTDDYKEHDVTLTDTSAMMLDNNVENTEIEKQNKKFQVDKESVREKSKFDFSRNYASRKHSFKLAMNAFNTKIEVFKPNLTDEQKEEHKQLEIMTNKSGTMSPLSSINSNSSSLLSTLNNEYYYRVEGASLLGERRKLATSFSKKTTTGAVVGGDTHTRTDISRIPINIELLKQNSRVVEAKCLTNFWKNYIVA